MAQLGWADEDVSMVEHHVSAGITRVGPPGRDNDSVGVLGNTIKIITPRLDYSES